MMEKIPQAKPKGTLEKLPVRLHHHAYTTDDHERNRRFYEDVLGLPLIAMYIEREMLEGEMVELGHAFYGIGDGGALAFFNFADPEKQAAYRVKEQPLTAHIALQVERSTQDEIKGRLAAAGIDCRVIDHGFCVSLYVQDPNGLSLEFTVDHKEAAAIAAEMAASAHSDMRKWMAGDRMPNNRWRPELTQEA